MKELNAGLHITLLLLLFLALALALVSMGFAILNMIQVPYRAVNGPGGICLWNVLAGKGGPMGREIPAHITRRLGSKQVGRRCEGVKIPHVKLHLPGPVTFLMGTNVLLTKSGRIAVIRKS